MLFSGRGRHAGGRRARFRAGAVEFPKDLAAGGAELAAAGSPAAAGAARPLRGCFRRWLFPGSQWQV